MSGSCFLALARCESEVDDTCRKYTLDVSVRELCTFVPNSNPNIREALADAGCFERMRDTHQSTSLIAFERRIATRLRHWDPGCVSGVIISDHREHSRRHTQLQSLHLHMGLLYDAARWGGAITDAGLPACPTPPRWTGHVSGMTRVKKFSIKVNAFAALVQH